MLDRILQFIRERLVALNTAINNLDKKSNSLSSTVNTLSSNHNALSNSVSGLTSNYNALSNKVNDNTQSIAKLKEDTGWVKLTKSTNWDGASDYCTYRKVGQFVEIRFMVTPKTTYPAGGNPLLIAYGLPKDAQPREWTARNVAHHNGNAYRFDVGLVNSDKAGGLRLYRNVRDVTKGYIVVGHIMYIAGGGLD